MKVLTLALIYICLCGVYGAKHCPDPAKCADCHMYEVPNQGCCANKPGDEYTVKPKDVDGSCGAANHPCITAYIGINGWGSPNCGKCFKVTIKEPGTTTDACKGSKCAAYQKSIYVRAIDLTAAADFEISPDGWHKLCPVVCLGTSACVQDASECATTSRPIPDTCQSGYRPIEYEEVTCGSAPPAPKDTTKPSGPKPQSTTQGRAGPGPGPGPKQTSTGAPGDKTTAPGGGNNTCSDPSDPKVCTHYKCANTTNIKENQRCNADLQCDQFCQQVTKSDVRCKKYKGKEYRDCVHLGKPWGPGYWNYGCTWKGCAKPKDGAAIHTYGAPSAILAVFGLLYYF